MVIENLHSADDAEDWKKRSLHDPDNYAEGFYMNILSQVTAPISGRFAASSAEKLRGGYYTPPAVAEWLCKWAIRHSHDRVLEPSAGDGAFMEAAAKRLLSLGAEASSIADALLGVELLSAEAETASARLHASVGPAAKSMIVNSDFFSWISVKDRTYDVIVGNPPFIRYQTFPEPHRTLAMELMRNAGLKPNKLTNIWVPFVVAAAKMLSLGGRMAMVIPAELLQVTYAAQLRTYLTERFSHIDVVACNELFFAGAEQEVVLLLADGARAPVGTGCRVAFTESPTVADVIKSDPFDILSRSEEKDVRGDKEKWLKYFLNNREIGLMRELRSHQKIVCLQSLGDVDVGIVTGANEFFVLRRSEVDDRNLQAVVVPTISRSSHIRGAVLSSDDWRELSSRDERVHLVDIRRGPDGLSDAAAASYVKNGEARGFHLGYKCSIRKPWYHVPSIWSPHGFLFRQIHDFPRFVLNSADALATDTIHRVRAKSGVAPQSLTAASFSFLTGASSEIEGRSYGGGVLELEPTEAERLLFPAQSELEYAMPLLEADRLLRAGRLEDVLEFNGIALLHRRLGLTLQEVQSLKDIWTKMRERRYSRGRRKKHA